MKIFSATILFVTLNLFSFTQEIDSAKTDSVYLSVPTIIDTTNWWVSEMIFTNSGPDYFWISIPTCSCLKLKDEQFYLQNDSIPYTGACVVPNIPSEGWFFYQLPYHQHPDRYSGDYYFSGFTFFGQSSNIKIISNYTDGKRNGRREYYNKEGKLIKTEVYENGVLVSTY